MFDAQQALLDLLQPGALYQTLFPPSSRYHGIAVSIYRSPSGQLHAYLQRRYLPALEDLTIVREHTVAQNERLDHIANRYLGDPEQFWRVADANTEMNPERLVERPGRVVGISLPEGISNATRL